MSEIGEEKGNIFSSLKKFAEENRMYQEYIKDVLFDRLDKMEKKIEVLENKFSDIKDNCFVNRMNFEKSFKEYEKLFSDEQKKIELDIKELRSSQSTEIKWITYLIITAVSIVSSVITSIVSKFLLLSVK